MQYKREIRQLWQIARHYLAEAKKVKSLVSSLDVTSNQVAKMYAAEKVDTQTSTLNMGFANLASAGIRLHTIDETFEKADKPPVSPTYITGAMKQLDYSGVKNELKRNIEKYLPELLRDNVGHTEPVKTSESIRRARKSVLGEMTLQTMLETMEKIEEIYSGQLSKRKVRLKDVN